MKKRKILFLGLLAIMLFCGIGKVDAKTTYTAYKAGDKITVNVSDSTKLDFYVIADSDASSSTVEAIMAETSYPTKTSYGNIDITLASYAVSWTNIDTNKEFKLIIGTNTYNTFEEASDYIKGDATSGYYVDLTLVSKTATVEVSYWEIFTGTNS